jgi:hypothetical protein
MNFSSWRENSTSEPVITIAQQHHKESREKAIEVRGKNFEMKEIEK